MAEDLMAEMQRKQFESFLALAEGIGAEVSRLDRNGLDPGLCLTFTNGTRLKFFVDGPLQLSPEQRVVYSIVELCDAQYDGSPQSAGQNSVWVKATSISNSRIHRAKK